MPRPYSLQLIIKVLKHKGFVFVSQNGSHAKYRKRHRATVKTVIVPVHGKEIKYGTFRSILRQSGLKERDFKG